MEYKDTLVLDLAMQQPLRAIRAKQYDNDTRKITAAFKDSRTNTPLTIPVGARAELRVERRDGVLVIIQGEISNNNVTATLTSDALACAGRAWCDFRVTMGDEILAASGFVMDIQPTAKGRVPSGYESETINIRRLSYEDYQAIPEKSPNTIYVTYDRVTGESWIFFGGFEVAGSRAGLIGEQGLTREQIYALICAVIDGGTVGDVDTGFVTTLKEINNGLGFRVWLGTTAEFEYLKANDLLEANVLYLRSDDKTVMFPGVMDPTKTLQEVIAMADNFMVYKLTTTPNTEIYPVEITQATSSSNGATVVYCAAEGAGFFTFTYGSDIYINRFYASQAQGGYTFTGWLKVVLGDTGWQTLTISGTGFTAGSPTPQYRKIGNRVLVKGQIAVDMDNVSDVTTVFATLPSGYRPATALYRLIPGEGDRQARLYVSSSGGVNINYFKTYAGDTVTGSHWVQLDCEFLTD